MATWAENIDEDVIYDDGERDRFQDGVDEGDYSDDYDNDGDFDDSAANVEELWANAEVVQEFEVDSEGRRYEVIKKVRRYHVDRPVTPADLRARFKVFGKGTTDQKHLVSKEPPLALEMGTVDEYERKSRDEVKRFIFETSGLEVKVTDPKFAIVEKEERIRKQQKEGYATASPNEGGSSDATWAGSRATAKRSAQDEDPDVARKVRITNLSDNVTETNLRTIFSADGMEVERVFLPTDKATGKVRGFAFLTFRDKWMADEALKKRSLRFKNLVLNVCRAVAKKD